VRARLSPFAAFLAASLVASAARSADPPPAASSAPVATPIDALGPDLAAAFSGWNLVFYGAAFAETGAMAFGGGDHAVRVYVRQHFASQAWSDAANVSGYVFPALAAPGVWLLGLIVRDDYLLGAGSAAMQALAATLLTTDLLKWTTGRPYPLNGGDPRAPDVLDHPEYARQFRPFRLDGAWSWPSGHTSSAISVVAALSAWDPDHVAIPLVGYPIASLIALGMIDGDRHWTSDVIAGALFGYALGTSIGASFHRRAHAAPGQAREPSVELVPMAGGVFGLSVVGAW